MKWLIAYVWIMSIYGALYFGHEIGFVNGGIEERAANRNRLESCQKVIAGNMYAR